MNLKYCLNCGKKLKRSTNTYCSNYCLQEKIYKDYINRWKQGLETGVLADCSTSNHLKRYLLEKYNNKCSHCGWGETNMHTGKIPLEIEHKDGDYSNNKEENLDLLCPNCHSLISTYKGANKGNGRKYRHKYLKNENIQKEQPMLKKKNECLICGNPTNNKYTCSRKCRTIYEQKEIPKHNISKIATKIELTEDLKNMSILKIGERYCVSDNTIRN